MMIWTNETLHLELDAQGRIIALRDRIAGRELHPALPSPLLHIVLAEGRPEAPQSLRIDAQQLVFTFASGQEVVIALTEYAHYLRLEVVQATGPAIETLLWGPIYTELSETIGESVGVVRDQTHALGLQVLNPQTIGGWPLELPPPALAAATFDQSLLTPNPDGDAPSDNKFEYPYCTAWPAACGSLLQAYVRDRRRSSRRKVWHLPDIKVAPIDHPEASLIGSAIALFACPTPDVLSVLSEIEQGEGLPHPQLDGVWSKLSPEATASYLITDFSEETMREVLDYTRQAGLRYVYHPEPFASWGHFTLCPDVFPRGDDSLIACAQEARDSGIGVGLHTLTTFTTHNDSYVTPMPDERLQRVGSANLLMPVDIDTVEWVIDDPEPFRHNLYRKTAIIGSELIEYEQLSEQAPWRLMGVTRGILGTQAQAHLAGASVGRLWDHPYDVYFPDFTLQERYADRLAELYQKAGLRQISFDGLEGLYASGHDDYGVVRFVSSIAERWGEGVINDASIVVPNYLWHIATRFNWGEPWGAAMREGQLAWRLSNQRYFARNYIPPMLGWFLLRAATDRFEATSLDEIEWVMAKAAGFDAGFALVADRAALRGNGQTTRLLQAVREWEKARRAGAFSESQRLRMRQAAGDWHLQPQDEGGWLLYPLHLSRVYVCDPGELQPGQPGGADWVVHNPLEPQPLRFVLRVLPPYGAAGGSVDNPTFYVGGVCMRFDVRLDASDYLVCEDGHTGQVYDRNWTLRREVVASAEAPMLISGMQALSFACRFGGPAKPTVNVRLKLYGSPEFVAHPD